MTMTIVTAVWDYDTDDCGYPLQVREGIRCGECKQRHQSVAAVRACHQIAEQQRQQAADEIWAENAWLRAAEAGTPDTWREEELERMAEACGTPVPPGFY
jgi:hypothetical protein